MARDGYACINCATWPILRPRAAATATGAIGPRVVTRGTRRPSGRRSARRLGSSVDGQTPWPRSGWERQGAQSRQGGTELVLPGPALGKCRVKRRVLRVIRPTREKKLRGKVFVFATGSPSPMRVVQRRPPLEGQGGGGAGVGGFAIDPGPDDPQGGFGCAEGQSPRTRLSSASSSRTLASAASARTRSPSKVAMCSPVAGSWQPSRPSCQRQFTFNTALYPSSTPLATSATPIASYAPPPTGPRPDGRHDTRRWRRICSTPYPQPLVELPLLPHVNMPRALRRYLQHQVRRFPLLRHHVLVGVPVGRRAHAQGHQQVGIAHLGAPPSGDALLTGHDGSFGIAQELFQVLELDWAPADSGAVQRQLRHVAGTLRLALYPQIPTTCTKTVSPSKLITA